MKKTFFVMLSLTLVILSCTKEKSSDTLQEQTTQTVDTISTTELVNENSKPKFVPDKTYSLSELYNVSKLKDLEYLEIVDPIFWNLPMQEGMYQLLLERNDINGVIRFREYIENLAEFRGGEPVYEYNPVIFAMIHYPKLLSLLYEKRPDLFLHGHYNQGDYTVSPIIYALRENNLNSVQFFLNNHIPWEKSKEMYGTRNRGGKEYPLGGSLLTDAATQSIFKYLIEQGFESAMDISNQEIYINVPVINVFAEPDLNSEIVCRLEKSVTIKPLKITLSKNDSYQWIYFEAQTGETGWAPFQKSIDYVSGA
jgi:hypothetical protein